MESINLDPRLRLIQQAEMRDKTVLIRVDHNVVKDGKIKDPYRIDATFGTLYTVAQRGGRPILMTHVGRPKDKKTGHINCREEQSVEPIVRYLEQKLFTKIHIPAFNADPEKGILGIDPSIQTAIEDLKSGEFAMIYLPNTRWFQGEQSSGPDRERFARELAGLADLFVNDSFGSWQAHVSTFDVAKLLPSYAGGLLQRELANLHRVLRPQRPFVGIIAGAKYDTKIGPIKALYEKVDHLILGGLLYNTYLATKYGVDIAGVSKEDKILAASLVEQDHKEHKILEMPYLVESETIEGKREGEYRTLALQDIGKKGKVKYILDIHPNSMAQGRIKEVIGSAKTIFINAVMGLMPHFPEGSEALYRLIAANDTAVKLFAGGDTLQEFRNLCPGIYLSGLDDPNTYYFTGGGSVLTAIEKGSPYGLKPVEALMEG